VVQHRSIDKISIIAASTVLLEVDNCERHYKEIFAAVCICSDAQLEIPKKKAPASMRANSFSALLERLRRSMHRDESVELLFK
jgi:hypothetical protein